MRGLETFTVLIADDSKHMRTLLRSMLHAYGFRRIIEAGDGYAAFEMMCDQYVDLALVDWVMNGVEGARLTQLIRNHPGIANPYCTVIMMSGHSHLAHVARARDSGINTFLAKPISAQTLRQHLQFVFHETRPFVRCARYVGPDRRLGKVRRYGGLMRRAADRASGAPDAAPPAISP
jgi:CheY-like chemotaxis protein